MTVYKLNNSNLLEEFGFVVSGSKGLIDLPKQKEIKKLNFKDAHGEPISSVKTLYSQREIVLEGFIVYDDNADLLKKTQNLTSILSQNGLKKLLVCVEGIEKELVFLVYNPDGISFDKKFNNKKGFCKCSLKLIEPEPVKKVFKYLATTKSIVIDVKTNGYLSVYVNNILIDDFVGNRLLELDVEQIENTHIIAIGELDGLKSVKINNIEQL